MNNCPITVLGSISLMYISQTLNTLKELYKQRVVTWNPRWKCALNVGIHQPIDPRPSGTESQGPHPMCDANAAAHTPSCANHGFFQRHVSKQNMLQHHFLVGRGNWRGNKLMHQCGIKHCWKRHFFQKIKSIVAGILSTQPCAHKQTEQFGSWMGFGVHLSDTSCKPLSTSSQRHFCIYVHPLWISAKKGETTLPASQKSLQTKQIVDTT